VGVGVGSVVGVEIGDCGLGAPSGELCGRLGCERGAMRVVAWSRGLGADVDGVSDRRSRMGGRVDGVHIPECGGRDVVFGASRGQRQRATVVAESRPVLGVGQAGGVLHM